MTPRDERIEEIIGRILIAAEVDRNTWNKPMNSAIHDVMMSVSCKIMLIMKEGGKEWRVGKV